MSTTMTFRKYDIRGKAEKTAVMNGVMRESYLQGDKIIFGKYFCKSLRNYFRNHKNKIKYNFKR